jgi:hypothetical protein
MKINAQNTATVIILSGRTGKDHLLAEIAAIAAHGLKPRYSSKSSARKAAERAIFRVIGSRPLYAGCAAGLVGGAA